MGQLGHDDKTNAPKIVNTLKDIQQISYGSSGYHFIAKNSRKKIFVTGNNHNGQLGTGDTKSAPFGETKYYTVEQKVPENKLNPNGFYCFYFFGLPQ